MKIAVVGAGYAGLAVAWHLLQKNMDVTVFDGGQGASHVSTGLLHPAPGKKAKPTWRAQEGMEATRELLQIAGEGAFLPNGIFRWIEGEKHWIPEGITVFSKKYLTGLKLACSKAAFIKTKAKKEDLHNFDRVILTVGAESLEWADLPLKKTIGQCLICRTDEPIEVSLLSQGHITPTEEKGICLVGSTYEHTETPDPNKALGLIDQVSKFYPNAKNFKVLDILFGVRISPKVGYIPIIKQIDAKTWVFTGLGSRGLIYHSLLAKSLVSRMLLA